MGNSLAVQWLGLGAFGDVAWVQSLVGELRSHKLGDTHTQKEGRTEALLIQGTWPGWQKISYYASLVLPASSLFLFSLSQQTLTEHLLCVNCCPRCWADSNRCGPLGPLSSSPRLNAETLNTDVLLLCLSSLKIGRAHV